MVRFQAFQLDVEAGAGHQVLAFRQAENSNLTNHVMIVLRKDDVAQLAEGHQLLADQDGIAILRCRAEGDGWRCIAVETPAPLPRPFDIRSPELTRDMTETIQNCFDGFQSEGELSIESNARGLWFVLPWGQRLFIGLARLHGELPAREWSQKPAELEKSGSPSCAPLRPR